MKKDDLKIFHGLSEVAGQGWWTVLGLKENGFDASMSVWYLSRAGPPYDFNLNINKAKKHLIPWYAVKLFSFWIYAFFNYDLFHFHYGRSFFFNLELPLYKIFGKKVIFEFHGSELRISKLSAYEYKKFFFEDDYNELYDNKRIKNAMKICKYADAIILHDDELFHHLPENHPSVIVIPLRIIVNDFTPSYPSIKEAPITIVHAPSRRKVKGTDFILKVISELKVKYDINLILVENKTLEEAYKIYKNADIIVDQILCGTYGVFAIEGMALGKPVVTYISDQMQGAFPSELPIQNASINNIYEVLEKLIQDPHLRHDIGVRSRKYVEKYHDHIKVTKLLNQVYDGTISYTLRGKDAFYKVAELNK